MGENATRKFVPVNKVNLPGAGGDSLAGRECVGRILHRFYFAERQESGRIR
jgi:hypothetical protein